MRKDTIVFDLGGVLIDWNPEYVFKEVIPEAERRRYFFENICTQDWNLEQDAGRTLQAGTELLVAEHPDWEPEIRAFYGRWRDMLGGPIDETVEIFRNLKNRGEHRLYALTNWSHETFPVALEMFDFLHWFDGRLVSGEEKTRKPFREIYELLLRRYDIHPTQAIFIDDVLKNVETAREVGLHGIHFQSAGQLKTELKKLGIEV